MAVTIDATEGGSSSNSYCTLAEVDTYLESVPWFFSTWDALTDATKNTWLVFAARAVDRLKFEGARYDKDQALEFPRTITDDQTDEGDLPQKVKDAQCEMIVYLYNHISTDDGSPEKEIDRIQLGRGALDVEFRKNIKPDYRLAGGYPETVKSLLREWLISDYNVEVLRG